MNQGYATQARPMDMMAGEPRIPEVPSGIERIRQETELSRKLIEDLTQRLCSVMRPAIPTAQAENLKLAQSPQSDVAVKLTELSNTISSGNDVLRDLLHRLEL